MGLAGCQIPRLNGCTFLRQIKTTTAKLAETGETCWTPRSTSGEIHEIMAAAAADPVARCNMAVRAGLQSGLYSQALRATFLQGGAPLGALACPPRGHCIGPSPVQLWANVQ